MEPAGEVNLVRNWACALILCPYGTPSLAAQSPLRDTLGPWGEEWGAIATEAMQLQHDLYLADPFHAHHPLVVAPPRIVGPPSPADTQDAVEALLRLAVRPKAELAAVARAWHPDWNSPSHYPAMLLAHAGYEPSPPASLYADDDYGDGEDPYYLDLAASDADAASEGPRSAKRTPLRRCPCQLTRLSALGRARDSAWRVALLPGGVLHTPRGMARGPGTGARYSALVPGCV